MTTQELMPVYKADTHEQVATMQKVAKELGEQATAHAVDVPKEPEVIDFYVSWGFTD